MSLFLKRGGRGGGAEGRGGVLCVPLRYLCDTPRFISPWGPVHLPVTEDMQV